MTRNNIITRALLDALGVAAYVVAFAFCVGNFEKIFGPQQDGWINIALVLILFIVSACVTGSLVLLKPILLYVEGQKKEAVQMFVYTVLFLFLIILASIIVFILISSSV
ncbi:MAG TPA: hypothetical protein VK675_00355 [Candidatus Paceibacterota bacterium]|nr:hypothetical protein [Candidatus Paceibacterota bacterium]